MAVTRVKIAEEANVVNANEHALNVRACHGFAGLAADDANSDGQTGTQCSRRYSAHLRS